MAKTAEITLGSVKFTAHKFNIGEHEQLAEIADQFGVGKIKGNVSSAIAVVTLAMRRDNPEATEADVRAIEAGMSDLIAASSKIMLLNGFVAEGKAPAGTGE